MKGWYGDSYTHGLASKGIKSNMKCYGRRNNDNDYSPEINSKLIDLSNALMNSRDDIEDAKVDYRNKLMEVVKLLDNNIGAIRNEHGLTLHDAILEYDNHPFHIIMDYYNLVKPFEKGDILWDMDYQTWFHVTNRIDKYEYEGYYFNEQGKKVNTRLPYTVLRRE